MFDYHLDGDEADPGSLITLDNVQIRDLLNVINNNKTGLSISASLVGKVVTIEEPFNILDSYLLGNILDSEADKILRQIAGNQTLDIYKTSNSKDTNDYQRYDAYIIGWTKYYNDRFFNNGSTQINSAVVKAMMWKESKIGYYTSSSPNANVSVDVLQTLDPRNPPIYEFSTYSLDTTKNVKILDGSGNYVLPSTIDSMYSYQEGRTTYETPVADRLFKQESDGFYHYQYQNAFPLLSVSLGIKEYAIKLSEANGNALIAAQEYNGSTHKVKYMNDVDNLAFEGGYAHADSYN